MRACSCGFGRRGRPYDRPIDADALHSTDPGIRRQAALGLGRRARRALEGRAAGWPPFSPGALNAWLLLVTTKPPAWQDELLRWREEPPTLGQPHQGFFYPDPLGFWAEVRRWATVLARRSRPEWGPSEALTVTTLLHVGDDPGRLGWGLDLMQPHVLLFLDAPSWQAAAAAGLEVRRPQPHHVPDPHRPKQVYEGFWATTDEGRVVGKSPQHPSTHRLYRAEDMDAFLRAAPL